MAEPTGLIAKSGIELLTFGEHTSPPPFPSQAPSSPPPLGTPNGVKASILLEELKAAYGTPYTFQAINISQNTQKAPWYTALNPNGRIPTIIDHDRGAFPVFEGLAILTYLTRHYDRDHLFSFPVESDDYSVAEQWIAWQHGGLGPMQGQANHFLRAAPERLAYPIQRYVGEVERLYGILDKRLEGREYVAGEGKGRYSIADISLVGWVNGSRFGGIDLPGMFPNVQGWLERVVERPAVKKGLAVPGGSVSRFSNGSLKEGAWEEGRKMVEEGDRLIREAKEKYGYKYASP